MWPCDTGKGRKLIALFARGETVIRNVPHLRHKEIDRLYVIFHEWRRLGGVLKKWMIVLLSMVEKNFPEHCWVPMMTTV
jgi:hypothetical protein